MRKKTWLSVVAMLLVTAMLIPMVGVAEEAKVTWDSPDLSWRKDTSPITLSLFFDIAWAPFDVWGSDHVSQKITEITGVNFEATKAQDANHLALLIATDELPDIIFDWRNKSLCETSEVSMPWNELIPQYAPEFMDLIDPSEIALATQPDGNYYTLYTHVRNDEYWADPTRGVSYGEPSIHFRDDIMEELGMTANDIQTMDDFYNVLVKVKELHPEMTPFLQPKLNGQALQGWFGINQDSGTSYSVVLEDGSTCFSQADEAPVREYLTFMNKLSREGLLSQEGLTYDFEKQKAAVMAGNVFATACQIWDVDLLNESLDSIEENTLRYTALNHPLKVGDELKYVPVYAASGFAGVYISKNCKDPARAIALIEFLKSPEGDKLTQWGVEGLDYELIDGLPIQDTQYTWKERGDNVWYFQASFDAELQKALAKVVTTPEYGQVGQLVLDFKPYWTNNTALTMVKVPAETRVSEIRGSMTELATNGYATAITAKTEEESVAAMDKLFADLKSVGLDEFNEYITAEYKIAQEKVNAAVQ